MGGEERGKEENTRDTYLLKILPRAYSCLGFSCVGGHNNGSLQEFSI